MHGRRRIELRRIDGVSRFAIGRSQKVNIASPSIGLGEEGSGPMRIGDRDVAVRPGLALYVPPGALHDFRGDGTRPLRAIQVHTPAGAEQRLRAGAQEPRNAGTQGNTGRR